MTMVAETPTTVAKPRKIRGDCPGVHLEFKGEVVGAGVAKTVLDNGLLVSVILQFLPLYVIDSRSVLADFDGAFLVHRIDGDYAIDLAAVFYPVQGDLGRGSVQTQTHAVGLSVFGGGYDFAPFAESIVDKSFLPCMVSLLSTHPSLIMLDLSAFSPHRLWDISQIAIKDFRTTEKILSRNSV